MHTYQHFIFCISKTSPLASYSMTSFFLIINNCFDVDLQLVKEFSTGFQNLFLHSLPPVIPVTTPMLFLIFFFFIMIILARCGFAVSFTLLHISLFTPKHFQCKGLPSTKRARSSREAIWKSPKLISFIKSVKTMELNR